MKNITYKLKFNFILLSILVLYSPSFVLALETIDINIYIKDHRFEPDIIRVCENQKIRLIIHNMDETIEEFDSDDLKREKIIPSNSKIHIILAPLKLGTYKFIGEFHPETAKGIIIVE